MDAQPSRPSLAGAMLGVAAMVATASGVVALSVAAGGDDPGAEVAAGGGTAAAATVDVHLSEFAIEPGAITIQAGGTLAVMNMGSVPHNLAVDGTELRTSDLSSGGMEDLTVDLEPGSYELTCLIPGHADAGMRASLTVAAAGAGGEVAGGATTTTGGSAGDGMDYEAMTAAMLDTMAQFPAATEGLGNPVLEPTEVLPDGTKVFDLVAAITPWEVSPGHIVDAWTYNGVVPAPSIHLEVGDRAQFRLTNNLPIGTDLHLHGLNVDNEFDGVAPITQDLIEPGETFTYEYTADEVSVAMYHPHFHSQVGLPNGMFGAIFVGQVPIPRGRTIGGEVIPDDLVVSQELPMVLNDSGVIGYSLNGKSFPATAPITAATGDWVLIHYFNEGTQIHPMHLHQFDQVVIAKDGFPLDEPYVADVVNVAPGERYSVLVQLDKPGAWVWHCHILPHVETEDGMFGMVTAVIVS